MKVLIDLSGAHACEDLTLLSEAYQALERIIAGMGKRDDPACILAILNTLQAESMKHLPKPVLSG